VVGLVLSNAETKRLDSPYRSGRSPNWVKVKNPNAPAIGAEKDQVKKNPAAMGVVAAGSFRDLKANKINLKKSERQYCDADH
jgi:hypothetical protein